MGENPAEYKQRIKERDEARRTYDETKKRKRLLDAARERQARKDAGLPEVEEEDTSKAKAKRRMSPAQKKMEEQRPWLPMIIGGLFVVVFGSALLSSFSGDKSKDS